MPSGAEFLLMTYSGACATRRQKHEFPHCSRSRSVLAERSLGRGTGKDSRNGKGCDLGYAPAICSCERAHSVDTRTVAALDVITAFAVPDPNSPSQDSSVFSGLVALRVAPLRRSLSLLRID